MTKRQLLFKTRVVSQIWNQVMIYMVKSIRRGYSPRTKRNLIMFVTMREFDTASALRYINLL